MTAVREAESQNTPNYYSEPNCSSPALAPLNTSSSSSNACASTYLNFKEQTNWRRRHIAWVILASHIPSQHVARSGARKSDVRRGRHIQKSHKLLIRFGRPPGRCLKPKYRAGPAMSLCCPCNVWAFVIVLRHVIIHKWQPTICQIVMFLQ